MLETRRLALFAIFHCNLLFSSIEAEDRATVIRRCYRPILDAAERFGLPFGIEATGLTLELARRLDPDFVARLGRLARAGVVEYIGSGYAQLIGPLVSPAVNRANLAAGQATARRLLGLTPRLAFVGEQAWSAGLVGAYLEAGFRGLILDFENARAACGLSAASGQTPVRTGGPEGTSLPVLFNHCLAFQKFQRYAQGELELPAYLRYLESKIGVGPVFSLYGNDAEIFDYRPGRFAAETALAPEGEWRRLEWFFAALGGDARFVVVTPSAALALGGAAETLPVVSLTTAAAPIAVKKQRKYNITRWAVTGRDDLRLNAACTLLAAGLSEPLPGAAVGRDWRTALRLFSSDYRTHITDRRWRRLRRSPVLRRAVAALDAAMVAAAPTAPEGTAPPAGVTPDAHHVCLRTPSVRVSLLPRKGLAVAAATFPTVADGPLAGTIAHGFFSEIALAADFFTGHCVFEAPGRPKVTDLVPCAPRFAATGETLAAGFTATLPVGRLVKTVLAARAAPRLEIAYDFTLTQPLFGSLRLFYVTLPPGAFERETLFFRAAQGGPAETFPLAPGCEVDHGRAVSFLVSASQGIGASNGSVEFGDRYKYLRATVVTPGYRPLGLFTCRDVAEGVFCRLAFSALETDETSRPWGRGPRRLCLRFALEAFGEKKAGLRPPGGKASLPDAP